MYTTVFFSNGTDLLSRRKHKNLVLLGKILISYIYILVDNILLVDTVI